MRVHRCSHECVCGVCLCVHRCSHECVCVWCVFACAHVFTRMCVCGVFVCRLVFICGSGCAGACGVFACMCAEYRYVCVACLWVCVCSAHMRVCACVCTSGLSHWPAAQAAEGQPARFWRQTGQGGGGGGATPRMGRPCLRGPGCCQRCPACCPGSLVRLLCCSMSWLLWGLGEVPAPCLAAAGLDAETWTLGNTVGMEQLDGAVVPAAGGTPPAACSPVCAAWLHAGLGPSGGP